MSPVGQDAGVAAERTRLAWARTSLSLAAAMAVAARVALPWLGWWALGVFVAGAAILAWWNLLLDRAARAADAAQVGAGRAAVVAGTTVVICLLGLTARLAAA
ncbi:DUF202 domain-containing protein [Nocardioides sp. NPDC101246]|uniref:DUF202 domain-containing protein n=1 Tax=Nocardioides sp. NPDC101246 TaxID=3364336 RepID=UPI00382970E0